MNTQIASSMKKVINLLVQKFDKHVQDKLRLIVEEEIAKKLNEKDEQ